MSSEESFISEIKQSLKNKDIAKAKENISEIIDKGNVSLEILELAIQVYRASEDLKSSCEYSQMMIHRYPEQASGFIYASQDLIGLHDLELAKELTKNGLQLHPRNTTLKVILWSIYRQESNHIDCEKISNDIIEDMPNNILGYNLKLKSLSKLDDNASRYKLIAQAELCIKDPVDLLTLKRTFYREIGATEAALLSSKMILSLKDTSISSADKIEFCKDLLLLNKVDHFISTTRQYGLVQEHEEKILKNLLTPGCLSILSKQEKKLLTYLEIFPHYNDPNFNPSTELVIKASENNPCVVFIHIGKCAGVSLINALRNSLGRHVKIFEYHAYDSNFLIENLLHSLKIKNNNNIFFIVPIRDPVKRWVSAFNYEMDLYYLKKSFYSTEYVHDLFSRYQTSYDLIKGLIQGDNCAVEFTGFYHLCIGHMAMGFNWYLQNNTVSLLPKNRTYVVRLEDIELDLSDAVSSILSHITKSDIEKQNASIKKLNVMAKNSFDRHLIVNHSDLSDEAIDFLREYLDSEYIAIRQILKATV